MTTPILEAKSLYKSFENAHSELPVIAGVSFAMTPGEFVCIVGPSGCGKSTLLQLLAGLLRPTEGEVMLAGAPLVEPHPDISVVFQKPNLMPWRTVMDNVLLPLQIHAIPADEAQKRGSDALTMVGLDEFALSYPQQLSGGMEQRVAVARALIQQPRILLLDEPFGALDALTRERLNLELLRLWHSRQLTALMVTHDIHEAVFLADRILVLSPRPATVAAEFTNTLPRPRPKNIEYSPAFGDLAFRIRQAIKE